MLGRAPGCACGACRSRHARHHSSKGTHRDSTCRVVFGGTLLCRRACPAAAAGSPYRPSGACLGPRPPLAACAICASHRPRNIGLGPATRAALGGLTPNAPRRSCSTTVTARAQAIPPEDEEVADGPEALQVHVGPLVDYGIGRDLVAAHVGTGRGGIGDSTIGGRVAT